jgi:CBS domain-containing protein
MHAADMMTSKVVTIAPDAPLRDAVWLMLTNRISAVPVVDDERQLVGIVSEGDLLRRAEVGTERHRSWWSEFNAGNEVLAAEFVKTHAHKVADVMTRRVVTARPDAPARDIAKLMEDHAIKRVPIVDDSGLVGVVSRADFLTALTGVWQKGVQKVEGNEQLRAAIVDRIKAMRWLQPSILNVAVNGDCVELTGFVETDSQKQAVRVAIEETPGVRAVEDNIRVQRLAAGY